MFEVMKRFGSKDITTVFRRALAMLIICTILDLHILCDSYKRSLNSLIECLLIKETIHVILS